MGPAATRVHVTVGDPDVAGRRGMGPRVKARILRGALCKRAREADWWALRTAGLAEKEAGG